MKFHRSDSYLLDFLRWFFLVAHKLSRILPRTQYCKYMQRIDFDDLLIRSRVLQTGVLDELSHEGDHVKLESRYGEK